MEREGVAAFLIGILGLACVALLAAGPVFYVYKNGFGALQPGRVNGTSQSERNAAAREERNSEREAQIAKEGLRQRYTVVPHFEDTYTHLYRDRDFTTVEQRLEAQFAKSADPYQGHLYSRYVASTSSLDRGYDPEHMGTVLDEWVAAMPDSYRARMIRGMYHIRMGQYHRGDGYANTVSAGSWRRMREEMALARADIEAARGMFDRDPEIFGSLGTISRYLDEGQVQAEQYYAQAVAVQPLSLSARIGLMTGALPKWGGSWGSVDAVLAECEALRPQFPLIMIVKREAERQMGERSPAHELALSTPEKKREWAEPYMEQLERNPGDPLLMTNAAYFLTESDSFAEAETQFRALGDTYHEGTNFDDLLHYNDLRGYVYAAVANAYPQGVENRRRAAEALEISPNHYYTNHVYGAALFHEGNYEAAARHFEASMNVNPNYPWSAVRLAECAEKRGDRATALRLARQVADRDPMPGAQDTAQAIIKRNS